MRTTVTCRAEQRSCDRCGFLILVGAEYHACDGEAFCAACGKELEPFVLCNEPPKPKPARFEDQCGRQSVLFAGLDCLSGQQDLFCTDGENHED